MQFWAYHVAALQVQHKLCHARRLGCTRCVQASNLGAKHQHSRARHFPPFELYGLNLSQVLLQPGSSACVQSSDGINEYGLHTTDYEAGLASSESGREALQVYQDSPLPRRLGSISNLISWSRMRAAVHFNNRDSFDPQLHGRTNSHGNTNCGVIDGGGADSADEVRGSSCLSLALGASA